MKMTRRDDICPDVQHPETGPEALGRERGRRAHDPVKQPVATEEANRSLRRQLADLQSRYDRLNQVQFVWREIIDAINEPLFVHDKEQRIVRTNRAFAEQTGMPVENLIGKNYLEVFENLGGPLASCIKTLRSNPEEDQEIHVPTGQAYHYHRFLLKDEAGNYVSTLHLLEDITEKQLGAAQRYIQSEALRQSSDGVLMMDPQTNITYANPAFYSLFGYEADEILGKPATLIELSSAQDKLSQYEIVEQAKRDGYWSGEITCSARKGTLIPACLTVKAITSDGGELLGFVGDFVDLGKIRETAHQVKTLQGVIQDLSAELELEAVGRKAVQAAVNLTGAGLGWVALPDEPDGVMRHFWHSGLSDAEAKQLDHGYPPQAGVSSLVLATGRSQFIDDYANFKPALPDYLKLGVRCMLAVPIGVKGAAGGVLVVACRAACQHDFNPEQIPVLEAVARQIGVAIQRENARNALVESERSYRTLAENLPGIVYRMFVREGNRMEFYNKVADSVTGYSPEELMAGEVCSIEPLILEEDRPGVVAEVKRAVAEDRQFDVEYRLRARDGSVKFMSEHGRPVRGADGAPRYIDGAIFDVSAHKQAERSKAREAMRLLALVELGKLAGAGEKAILDFVIEESLRITESRYSFLGWLNEDQTVMTIHAWSKDVMQDCGIERPPIAFPLAEAGVWAEAVRARAPFLLNDYAQPHPARHGTPPGHVEISRYLGVPVIEGDRVVAITSVANKAQDYDQTDAAALAEFVKEAWGLIQRKRAEESLLRTQRSLRVLSGSNQALLHAGNEPELCDMVCRILADTGGYRFAWIGFAGHDEAKSVRPVAWAGHESGYLDTLSITWADAGLGRGPTGTAIRTGKPSLARDIAADSNFGPWREQALSRGYRASLALPLAEGGKVFGALNVYAAEAGAFNDGEMHLLEELAADLAFGIHALRSGQEREHALSEMTRSEQRLSKIVETTADGIMVVSRTGSIQFLNPAAERLFGRPAADLLDTDFGFPLVIGETSEIDILRPGAPSASAEMRLLEMEWKGPPALVVSLHDVTERKRAEEEHFEATGRLRSALVGTIQAIAMTVEKRDPYTAGHQRGVADLAVAIGTEMGLDPERIEGMRLGATIHDIGKIYVPAEILNRPGKLSAAEFEIIKSHAEVGYDIIKDVKFPWPVADMIRQHHERIDGSGYPLGLKGEEICLEARILAVADVVESMSSHRPYRPALEVGAALNEIEKNCGRLYDEQAVKACVRIIKSGYAITGRQ